MKGKINFIRVFIFAGLLFLSACAGSVKEEDPGVQDIQPGEKSVIQPPSPQSPAPQGRQIEERNI